LLSRAEKREKRLNLSREAFSESDAGVQQKQIQGVLGVERLFLLGRNCDTEDSKRREIIAKTWPKEGKV